MFMSENWGVQMIAKMLFGFFVGSFLGANIAGDETGDVWMGFMLYIGAACAIVAGLIDRFVSGRRRAS
jgi:hypothetical protein